MGKKWEKEEDKLLNDEMQLLYATSTLSYYTIVPRSFPSSFFAYVFSIPFRSVLLFSLIRC